MIRFKALLLIILMFSCGTKKKTVERTKISDTLISSSITYKTEPIKSEYLINLECDTITGRIKPVDFKEVSGKNSAQIKIVDNKLQANLKVDKSETKIDTIYKTKFKDVFKDREVVRCKTPLWMWLVIIVEALIILLLVKKKIPFI